MESSAGVEELKGLKVERLKDGVALNECWHDIAGLEYNALDASERGWDKRGEKIKRLYQSYLASGKHGELFVLKKDGKIIAFLAINKNVEEKKATIEEFRLAKRYSQGKVIQEIFVFAQKFLEDHGYHRAEIEEGDKAYSSVQKLENRFPRFLKIEESKAELMPLAANDNESPPLREAA